MINIHVAVAIIFNDQKKILIAQRPPNKYASGLWEFPGGKIEQNETVEDALRREILEEVNLKILSAHSWLKVHHDYSDRRVLLDVWMVDQFLGEAKGMESQQICWIFPVELNQFVFPEGNQMIIEKIMKL